MSTTTPSKTGLTPFKIIHGRRYTIPTMSPNKTEIVIDERSIIDYMIRTMEERGKIE